MVEQTGWGDSGYRWDGSGNSTRTGSYCKMMHPDDALAVFIR
jgi:hypothetical protein